MGVRIDTARHDIAAAGINHFCTGGGLERGADRNDGLTVDENVGTARTIVIHDRAAADDESGHGISKQASCEHDMQG